MRAAVVVRAGTAADREFVHGLSVGTANVNVSSQRPAPTPMIEASMERLLAIVNDNPHLLFIAEVAGERAGFLLLLTDMPDEVTGLPQAFIPYTAVASNFRKQGVGTALLSAAEERARALGFAHISLMVTEENIPAKSAYDKLGYLTERRLLCKTL